MGSASAVYWLCLAVPVIGFYLLRVRLRRVPVSTLLFWGQVYDVKQPRSLWRTLRNLNSLLLQLLFLVLVVAGLCDFRPSGEDERRQRVVLVLDNSASMSASDVAPSRLIEAKRLAANEVRGLKAGDEIAVVSASRQPRVLCGLTEHPRTLLHSVEAVAQSDGPTAMQAAVELAQRLLAEHPRGRILVFSDGCFPGAEQLLRASEKSLNQQAARIEWRPIGEARQNVAITRFQVRRSLQDPLGIQAFCEVKNFGSEPVQCRLELLLNEAPIDVVPLKLKAGEQWTQTLQQTTEQGGELIARLDHADVLPVDNVARAVLPQRKRQSVTLVDSGNLFLQRVFEANSLVDLTVIDDVSKVANKSGLVVLHRRVPAELPSGDVIVLQPEAGCSFWELGERLEQPLVGKQEKDSPLLANVRLDNVLMPEARMVRPLVPVRVLIESANGEPLLLVFEHQRGRVVLLTVNLERGDLALRTAFPILISNILNWFDGGGGEIREALAVADVAQVEVPSSLLSGAESEMAQLQLTSPRGVRREVAVVRGRVLLGPLNEVGLWKLERVRNATSTAGADEPSLLLACNLANADESDLSAPAPVVDASARSTAAYARPIWVYLVLLAWLLTGLEWAMYQRRVVS